MSDLRGAGLNIRFFPLDLSSLENIERFLFFMEDNYVQVDILVNSAAVCLAGSDSCVLQETLQTNFWSLLYLTLQLFPFIERAGRARILNISSGDGELCFFSTALSSALRDCSTLQQLLDFSYDLCVSQTNSDSHLGRVAYTLFSKQPNILYRISKSTETYSWLSTFL